MLDKFLPIILSMTVMTSLGGTALATLFGFYAPAKQVESIAPALASAMLILSTVAAIGIYIKTKADLG